MNILVTGFMGHIGYSLTKYLVNNGHRVVGLFNSSQNKYPKVSLDKRKLIIKKINLSDEIQIREIIKKYKINCCIHTAAVSHEIYAQKDPLNTLKINSLSVLNILTAINDLKKKIKFINISTGSVFQEIKKKNKINENLTPTPKSIYAGTKRLGEIFVSSFNKNRKINCTSLRISWVYGPPIKLRENVIQRGPIPKILYDYIKKDKKKFLLKSGSDFKASFTYIDDVIENIYKLVRKKNVLKDIYHLGTGKNNTLEQLFKVLKRKDNNVSYVIGKGARPWSNDSIMRGPLVSKNNLLKSKYSLEQGVEKYLDWLNKNA